MSTRREAPLLTERLDDAFHRRASAAAVVDRDPGSTLPRKFLEDVEHLTSFPGLAVSVGDDPGTFHPPATCYRLFHEIAGSRLDGSRMFTVVGACRRNEETAEPGRLAEFTMREIVFFGALSGIAERRDRLMAADLAFASDRGLDAELREANDPFFGAEEANRGKLLLQKLMKLKYELVAPVAGWPVAIASFNLHGDFFTSRLHIDIAGVDAPSSGCVAYGIERWVEALRARWGPDELSWPGPIQDLLAPGDQ